MQVLITDDKYWPTLGIIRTLGRKRIRVSVMADSPRGLASHSRYCSRRYMVPCFDEPSFIPVVLDLVRRDHFDLVIPVTYQSTAALAEHKAELDQITRLEVADVNLIRAAADKGFANKLALSLGVPAPRTICPKNFAEAESFSRELEYPVVIKAAAETRYKHGVEYAQSRSELLSRYRTICDRATDVASPLPLIQEYVPGFGCGFFALYQQGVCKRIFMHRRVREVPPKGGISCCAESYYDPKLKRYGTRLLDQLGWHGVAMVEFRYDTRNNDYKLMEINPKFWGSLDLALTAGVDFPYWLCQMAQGQTIEYSEEFNRNLRFHWFVNEMRHLWYRPASIGTVLADSLNPRVKSSFQPDDLWPSLVEPFSRGRSFLSRWMSKTGVGAEPLVDKCIPPEPRGHETPRRVTALDDTVEKEVSTQEERLSL